MSKFIASELVFAAVAVFIMIRISPLITVAAFVPLIVILTVFIVARALISRTRKRSREATGDVVGFLGEMFGSAETIKVAGAEPHVLGEFDRVNVARKHAGLRDTLVHSDARRHLPQRAEHWYWRNSNRGRPGNTRWSVHRW